jgi:hypothetical protein
MQVEPIDPQDRLRDAIETLAAESDDLRATPDEVAAYERGFQNGRASALEESAAKIAALEKTISIIQRIVAD